MTGCKHPLGGDHIYEKGICIRCKEKFIMDRYELMTGRWGTYFWDNEIGASIDLEIILKLLNQRKT